MNASTINVKLFTLIGIILSLMLLLSCYSLAYAEERNKIAAVVGGEAISTLDVYNRALMVLNSSAEAPGAPRPPIEAVMPQALQMLIDEKLYSQEAERLHVAVTQADLDRAIAGIEAKNHLQPGGFDAFLEQRHIPAGTVKDQVRSQILLAKIVNAKIRPKVSITERELELEITRLGGNNRSYTLKQIFVPLAEKDNAAVEKVKAQLEHIQAKAKGCEHFDSVTNSENASLSPTELKVESASLNPTIRDVVNGLKVGEPSGILQTADSVQLLMVCERGQVTITPAEKQQLSTILLERKVELQAKQYLRNLRQETYVEIR